MASAWPAARRENRQLFNRARTHENLAFLFSCNCAGQEGGRACAGHGQFVDPWGRVRAEAGDGGQQLTAEVDMGEVEKARQEFPGPGDRVLKSETAPETPQAVADPAFDPASLRKFTDGVPYLNTYETGLYPGGTNEMPEGHRRIGERIAAGLKPLDVRGAPEGPARRLLALVLGHSNCRDYFTAFQTRLKEREAELLPDFRLLNAGVGSQQLQEISQLQGKVWDLADELLRQEACTREQVQVLFLHTTFHGARNKEGKPPREFPAAMREMERDLRKVLGHAARIYPNLRLAYLTCDGLRHFTGFEPHVWREAFAFKWLIESQIRRDPGTECEGERRELPWLSWGPYLWDASWDASYFTDGVHPATKAQDVFDRKYWNHLREDSVTRQWLPSSPLKKGAGSENERFLTGPRRE